MQQLSPELQANIDALLQTISHWMAQQGHRNVKDTGIIEELHRIRSDRQLPESPDIICMILQMMWDQADQAGDSKKLVRIETTQKGSKCRNIGKQR